MPVDPNQKQNIDQSSFQDSQTQQAQTRGDLLQNQNSGNQFMQLTHPIASVHKFPERTTSICNFLDILLSVSGALICWSLTLPGLILGSLLIGIAFCLYFLGFIFKKSRRQVHTSGINMPEKDKNIYMNGINYHDCVVHLKGYDLDINQEFSEVISDIKEALIQLQNSSSTLENAESKIINDLIEQSRNNQFLYEKILEWGRSIGSNTDGEEIARNVVKFASSTLYSSFHDPILVVGGKYQTLSQLLQNKQWKKADEETVKLIFKLSEKENIWITEQDIARLNGQDLKTINKLWLHYSKGRFGFSIQQQIWKEVQGIQFSKRVGWYADTDWHYYADLVYSLKAPPGHLPALISIDPSSFQDSYRFKINYSVFKTLMKRPY